jgi:hypothetical protein
MQYRLCWMIDGDEQVDHRLWPNKIVPEMVRNYLQEQFPAMEVRIEELEDDASTGGGSARLGGSNGDIRLEQSPSPESV